MTIKETVRAVENNEWSQNVADIFCIFRGLNNTTSIETRLKKVLITHMQDKTGTNKCDRQGIAKVFAEFYKELYASTIKTHEHEQPTTTHDDAVHDAGTRQSNQPTQKRPSCRRKRRQRRDDQAAHQKS